jgi:hypothetical protein
MRFIHLDDVVLPTRCGRQSFLDVVSVLLARGNLRRMEWQQDLVEHLLLIDPLHQSSTISVTRRVVPDARSRESPVA